MASIVIIDRYVLVRLVLNTEAMVSRCCGDRDEDEYCQVCEIDREVIRLAKLALRAERAKAGEGEG